MHLKYLKITHAFAFVYFIYTNFHQTAVCDRHVNSSSSTGVGVRASVRPAETNLSLIFPQNSLKARAWPHIVCSREEQISLSVFWLVWALLPCCLRLCATWRS